VKKKVITLEVAIVAKIRLLQNRRFRQNLMIVLGKEQKRPNTILSPSTSTATAALT
jgi:hypothetical protein